MFEKVNPCHPDKIADRIAGAIVDIAYSKAKNPRIAVEVLIGHGLCTVIAETSETITEEEIKKVVNRISPCRVETKAIIVPQDSHLSHNQENNIKCGDNGIFKGVPVTYEQIYLTNLAKEIYNKYNADGKYLIHNAGHTICQSSAKTKDLKKEYGGIVNPLGDWSGGTDVDTGATNRKLGSDMGDSVTGGGLHGKDLSKADVSVNIYAFLKAQLTGKTVELSCSIGDTEIDGMPYSAIVEIARKYIELKGGFEKFAEWGLVK